MLGVLGVDTKEKIHVARNAVYTSDKAIQEMIYAISKMSEMKILREMKNLNTLL